MVPALTVAALLVRLGIDNPVMLEVPANHRERATALVAQLGDRQFTERDRAARELEGMGRLALLAVRDGQRSADAEVRLRSGRLLPALETDELAARLLVFVADADGKYEHRVPGWELFRSAAGDDRPARDLFAEVTKNRDNWPLLAALRGPGIDVRAGLLAAAGGGGAFADRPPPVRAAQAAAVRRWQFFADREAPAGLDEEQTPRRPTDVPVPDMALVVLAETLYPERMRGGKGGRYEKDVNSYFGSHFGFRALQGDGRYGPAFARLGRLWMETRDGVGTMHAYARAKALHLDAATIRRYAARVLAQGDAVPTDLRIECLNRLAEERAVEHLGVIVGQFADTEQVPGVQVRDYALAAAVDLTGQLRADYGLAGSGPAGPLVIPPKTKPEQFGAVMAELRAAAFARWRDWEATHFGAVAGPAAVVGGRPDR